MMLTRNEPQARRYLPYRHCKTCDWPYIPKHTDDTVCNLCRTAASMPEHKRNERQRLAPPGICEVCHGPIPGRRSRKTCSDECNRIRITRYEHDRRRAA